MCLQIANIFAYFYEPVHILQALSDMLKQAQTLPMHVHPGEGDGQNQPVTHGQHLLLRLKVQEVRLQLR